MTAAKRLAVPLDERFILQLLTGLRRLQRSHTVTGVQNHEIK